MKRLINLSFLTITLFVNNISAQAVLNTFPENPDTNARYIIYIHGEIIEQQSTLNAVDEITGEYEFNQITNHLASEGFTVIAEPRLQHAKVMLSSINTINQITGMLNKKLKPENITLVGVDKGGIITLHVSTGLTNPDINYVVINTCNTFIENKYQKRDHALCGNLLSIYEKEDKDCKSCQTLFTRIKCDGQVNEVELKNKKNELKKYKADNEIMGLIVNWAKGNL